MTKWAELIIPIILTGLGVVVMGLFDRVDTITKTIHENKQYVIVQASLKEKLDDHEQRIRQHTQEINKLERCDK